MLSNFVKYILKEFVTSIAEFYFVSYVNNSINKYLLKAVTYYL